MPRLVDCEEIRCNFVHVEPPVADRQSGEALEAAHVANLAVEVSMSQLAAGLVDEQSVQPAARRASCWTSGCWSRVETRP